MGSVTPVPEAVPWAVIGTFVHAPVYGELDIVADRCLVISGEGHIVAIEPASQADSVLAQHRVDPSTVLRLQVIDTHQTGTEAHCVCCAECRTPPPRLPAVCLHTSCISTRRAAHNSTTRMSLNAHMLMPSKGSCRRVSSFPRGSWTLTAMRLKCATTQSSSSCV